MANEFDIPRSSESSGNQLKSLVESLNRLTADWYRSRAISLIGALLAISSAVMSVVVAHDSSQKANAISSKLSIAEKNSWQALEGINQASVLISNLPNNRRDLSPRQIITIEKELEKSRKSIQNISYSIDNTSVNILSNQVGYINNSKENWYVIVESYANSPIGLKFARQRANSLKSCAKLYEVNGGKNVAVSLLGPTSQKRTSDFVKSAKGALGSSAYARLDSNQNWKMIFQNDLCEIPAR